MPEDIQGWDELRFAAMLSECWWCGSRFRPPGWYAPWMIERAHIVNSPRRRDRRVAVLLCSRCHKVQHGEKIITLNEVVLVPSMPELIWLKRFRDASYYDRSYMQENHLGRLPRAVRPPDKRLFKIPAAKWCLFLKNWGSIRFGLNELSSAADLVNCLKSIGVQV